MKELARCAKDEPDYFEHFLSEKHQERERKQAFDLAVETLEAANVRVVDDPGYSGRSAMRRLSSRYCERVSAAASGASEA